MEQRCAALRLAACILVVVLAITFTAPARAEADVLTALAIGALVVAGFLIVVYLVIANVRESQRAEGPGETWVVSATGQGSPSPGPAAPPQSH